MIRELGDDDWIVRARKKTWEKRGRANAEEREARADAEGSGSESEEVDEVVQMEGKGDGEPLVTGRFY